MRFAYLAILLPFLTQPLLLPAAPAPIPLREDFANNSIPANWRQDLAKGNSFSAAGGILPKTLSKEESTQTWRYIGLEIDRDSIRSLISTDAGQSWTIVREMPRNNAPFSAPPKYLIVGKGASDPPRGLAKRDLNND